MPADSIAAECRQGIEELLGLLYADTPLKKIERRACVLARTALNAEDTAIEAAGKDAPRERSFERGPPARVCVPITYGDDVLGVLCATDNRRAEFSQHDADLLDVFARYIALARSNYAKIGGWTRHLRLQRRVRWIVTAAVLLITIAIALFGWFDARIAGSRVATRARQSADVSADHFERYVASAAQLCAATAAVAPRLRGDRAGTERLLQTLLQSARSDVVYGIGLWYAPYAFSPRRRFFGPYVHRMQHGGITLTYMWSTPSYDYPAHPWYRSGASAGSATAITGPYFDVDHVYISAVHQLRANGRFVGVSSVDMTSQSIDLFLRHIGSPDHLTYITQPNGRLVAFPNGGALVAFARKRHAAKRILDVTSADAAAFIAQTYSKNRIILRTPLHPMPLVVVDSWDPSAFAGARAPIVFLIALAVLVWALTAAALFFLRFADGRTRAALDVDRERARLELEIDTRLQAERALKRAEETDRLTGLADRFALIGAVERLIADRAHDGSSSNGLLLLDLNGLEAINQQAGHLAGDEVLVHAASLIRRCCAQTDTPARLGGDEFAVLVRGAARSRAATIAECVQRGMSSGLRIDEQTVFVDASAGFVEIAPDHKNAQDVIQDADYALTHAKRRGRAMTDFSPDLRAAANRERELQAALRGALARGELRVAYQPIYRLSDRAVVGVEALARWIRNGEVILPSEFIPVAERTGLVVDIDTYVARAAMRRVRALSSVRAVRLSLNVSALHFKSSEAFDALERTLTQNASASAVDIELTETAVMTLEGQPDDFVTRLRRSGVGMHLDDFGTGYSSLSYLKHLHVDALKIDRSFVAAMLHENRAMQIVDAIVQLARRLEIETIVEGIETAEQERVLRELGASMGQGYFFAEPMGGEALEEVLAAAP